MTTNEHKKTETGASTRDAVETAIDLTKADRSSSWEQLAEHARPTTNSWTDNDAPAAATESQRR